MTLGLVLYASVIIVVLGVGLGISRAGSGGLDTRGGGHLGVRGNPRVRGGDALLFVFGVKLRWFPALGNGTGLLSNVRHFTLPAIALAAHRWPSSPG